MNHACGTAIVLAVVMLFAPAVYPGHHSRGHYATEMTEMTGELVDIIWGSPHVYFRLRTTDTEGRERLWKMEAGSLYMLSRGGVTRDLFEVGEEVLVAGRVSNTRPNDFLVSNMLFDSGYEVLTLPDGTPRWGDQRIGGRALWIADVNRLQDTDPVQDGIFRVWSVPKEVAGWRRANLPFTESALASRLSWDPDDNFAIRCEPPGMPDILNGQPHPFDLLDEGDSILLRSEEFDVVRTIHMDQTAIPSNQPPSRLGYSIGRWEGDNKLVVETKRLDWPYFDRSGTAQSEIVETLEEFTLGMDQERLDYHITITDPDTFTEPATLDLYYLALGESVEPYECEVN